MHRDISAICAAPSILGKKGILKGRKATCYPGFDKYLEGADYTAGAVEKDGNIITARGAGVAVQFGLKLVETMCSKELADKINDSIRSL